jgi:predicted RNase H-like HicB family nuclease
MIDYLDAFPQLRENPGGTAIRGYRYREGLTQLQLAAITGISRRHISDMENGRRPIGKEDAKKLAQALNADYMMFCEDFLTYPAIITPAEEGGYLVNFPDFEGGAFTEGETLEEALYNAAEVLDLVLEDRRAKGQTIPAPGRIDGPNVYMVVPGVPGARRG